MPASAPPPDASPVPSAPFVPPARADGDVTLVRLLSAILRHRWLLLTSSTLAIAIFVGAGLRKPRTYAASASFMPHSGSSKSQISGLAAQFGLNVQAGDVTESPDFYVDLLRSREVLRQATETTYVFDTDSGRVRSSLLALYGGTHPNEDVRRVTARQALARRIKPTLAQKTGVITVVVEAPAPELAAAITANLLASVNTFNLESRRSHASLERQFVERRLEEVREDLRAAERRLAAFLVGNRNYHGSPSLVFEHDRLARDVATQQQLVTSLSQAYEQSRIEEVRDTPAISVVEYPEVPALPEPRGLLQRGLLGAVLGGLIGLLLALGREVVSRSRRDTGDACGELHALRREAVLDRRRPWRLMTRLLGNSR